jgi:hypothetical protein
MRVSPNEKCLTMLPATLPLPLLAKELRSTCPRLVVESPDEVFAKDSPVSLELNFALRTRADVRPFQTPDRNSATLES